VRRVIDLMMQDLGRLALKRAAVLVGAIFAFLVAGSVMAWM
jgi:hypothetical protein